MRRLFLPLVLAGCASVPSGNAPCACIIPETMEGLVALELDGTQLAFTETAATDGQRLPISSSLYALSEGAQGNGLVLSNAFYLIVEADFGPVIDLTQPVRLKDLFFSETVIANTALVGTTSHDLGPEGGMLRIEEIAPSADGGYRLRGSFTAQICPRREPPSAATCRELAGRFAFDEGSLPEGATTGNLLAGGS